MLSSTLDLISLPVEILVRIYESLGSFATVANLACCCSFMDTVYVANKAPISHAILRLDPILVGNSTDTSFYHQAVGIFLEGQKKINGTVNEGGNGDNADNYQLVDKSSLFRSFGIQAVKEVILNACIVNKTAEALTCNFAPTLDDGFCHREILCYEYSATDLLRWALWDLWHLSTQNKQLKIGMYGDMGTKPCHPKNRFVSHFFCHYMNNDKPRELGYPSTESVIPSEVYINGFSKAYFEIKEDLITEAEDIISRKQSWSSLADSGSVVCVSEGSHLAKLQYTMEELGYLRGLLDMLEYSLDTVHGMDCSQVAELETKMNSVLERGYLIIRELKLNVDAKVEENQGAFATLTNVHVVHEPRYEMVSEIN